jgi:Domain of unknown function (DUF4129)
MASAASAGAAALARRQAQSILAERRFHAASFPRPLHGVLHALGRALEAPLNVVNELASKLGSVTPGGTATVWAGLAVVVLVLCGLLAARGARRSLADRTVALRAGGAEPLRAADLERAAGAAEREGRHGDAVRLRFRAGLMLLAEKQLVEVAPSTINAEVSRVLRSRRFDELARRFDEITYGGSPAEREDVEVSRREWRHLLNAREG